MKARYSLTLIITGLAALMLSVVLLIVMVIHLIAPSFALSFLAYLSSSVGLIMGLTGIIRQSW